MTVPTPERMNKYDDRVYYEDLSSWQPMDYRRLWRYLNRLFLTIPAKPGQLEGPSKRKPLQRPEWATDAEWEAAQERRRFMVEHARQVRRIREGKYDEELCALDLSRTALETRYLMRHMLLMADRLEHAVEHYPNLAPLLEVPDALPQLLILDDDPLLCYDYLTEAGIIL